MQSASPFLEYGKVRLLNVPQAAVLAEESIVQDCYQIRNLKGTWAVADIGACYGEFSFFAASFGHIVHAWEASRPSMIIFKLNMRLNRLIEAHGAKVIGSPTNNPGTHYYRPNHPAGSGPDCGDGNAEFPVLTRMSYVVRQLREYGAPIFIKLDCEGDEVEIFDHIDTWIDGVEAVSMETHSHDADVLGKMLEDRGFTVKLSGTSPYPLPPWNKSMAGGLVIARKSLRTCFDLSEKPVAGKI